MHAEVNVLEMRWKGMNADLSKLSEFIYEFFQKKEFNVSVVKFNGNFRIIAKPGKFHGILGNILVSVEGEPNDFCVRMTPTSLTRNLIFLGRLFGFLGFGYLAVKGHKSEEKLVELEKEFKDFIAYKVWEVSGEK
jgi:hypothetical protein